MIKTIISRTVICLLVIILWILIFLIGAVGIGFYGPSQAARDLLVATFMETSAMKFIVRTCFTDEEIEYILAKNAVIASKKDAKIEVIIAEPEDDDFDINAVTLENVSGPTFKGKMLIVNDPSRVYVASPNGFDLPSGGLRVEEMVERDNAIAGINGGAFADENGVGNGGTPLGIVIQNGELTYGSKQMVGTVIGFDKDNKLIVSEMSGKKALELGMRDAVCFPTPPLISNGVAAEATGTGGGLNPRTAIGQRADGAVLLLVIDGRQAHSIGASYKDIIDVMLKYDAVTAGNLDGGSSTLMVYEDKIQNVCASLYGSRKLPTAVLVRQVEEK